MSKGLLIGFDLDGVLCDINVAVLETLRQLEGAKVLERGEIEREYYRERRPLLDGRQMLGPEDRAVVITARPKRLGPITKAWLKRHYPGWRFHLADHSKYRWEKRDVRHPYGKKKLVEVMPWYQATACAKAALIKKLGVNVYLDDNPEIVGELRRQCPGVTVLQYGGRVSYGEA